MNAEQISHPPDAMHDALPALEPAVDRMVGDKLRIYFDGLCEGPVPDRIVELIRALSEAEKKIDSDKRR